MELKKAPKRKAPNVESSDPCPDGAIGRGGAVSRMLAMR